MRTSLEGEWTFKTKQPRRIGEPNPGVRFRAFFTSAMVKTVVDWKEMLCVGGLTPAPTRDVGLTWTIARELEGGAMDLDSPALSAKVFRLGSGSNSASISERQE